MKRLAAALLTLSFYACGLPLEGEPASTLTAVGTGAVSMGTLPDGGWVDPCTLVNNRTHQNVVDTVATIDNSDPRCSTPPYEMQGAVTVDMLPIYNNQVSGCPITYTEASRMVPDGGMEPACHVTAACTLHGNGGDLSQNFDLLFDVYGTFRGTREDMSTGQLCPDVKVSCNNTGMP